MPPLTDQVYQAFLLRCWFIPSETSGEPPVWRFELQEVSPESLRYRFSDFEQLQAFVAGRLTAVVSHDGKPDTPERP